MLTLRTDSAVSHSRKPNKLVGGHGHAGRNPPLHPVRDDAFLTTSRNSCGCPAQPWGPIEYFVRRLIREPNLCAFFFRPQIVPHGELIMVVTASVGNLSSQTRRNPPHEGHHYIHLATVFTTWHTTLRSNHSLDDIPKSVRPSLRTRPAPQSGKGGVLRDHGLHVLRISKSPFSIEGLASPPPEI